MIVVARLFAIKDAIVYFEYICTTRALPLPSTLQKFRNELPSLFLVHIPTLSRLQGLLWYFEYHLNVLIDHNCTDGLADPVKSLRLHLQS